MPPLPRSSYATCAEEVEAGGGHAEEEEVVVEGGGGGMVEDPRGCSRSTDWGMGMMSIDRNSAAASGGLLVDNSEVEMIGDDGRRLEYGKKAGNAAANEVDVPVVASSDGVGWRC